MSEELKIPKERVAVLIGEKGATKRKIQKQTKTKLTITSEGDITIDSEDNYNVFAYDLFQKENRLYFFYNNQH